MVQFLFLDKEKADQILPLLFDILYGNMNSIAPTGQGYDADKWIWLSNVAPAIRKEPRQIILLYAGNDLAGFMQYYVNGGIFMVEEIQIKSQYQRTTLFYGLCSFMLEVVPRETAYIEAYAEARNENSRRILRKLGLQQIGENGNFLHYRGRLDTVRKRFEK